MGKKEIIKERFSELGISQREAAERIGIMPQALGNYIKGERNFGLAMAQKWSDAFGFNIQWLLTGTGPVLKDAKDSGTSISIGEYNHADGQSSITAHNVGENAVKIAELQSEIRHLTTENSHLKEMLKEKDARLVEKERMITYLMDNKMKKS